jgi:hypothetical protein
MCCLKFGELLVSKPYNSWPMRWAFFWEFTQRRLIVRNRRFGTTYWVPSSRAQPSFFLGCLTLEDGTDRFCRNVSYKLPIYASQRHRRATISLTSQRKSQITQMLASVIQIVYCSRTKYGMYCAAEIFVPDRDVYYSLTLRNPHDTPLCVELLRLMGFLIV